jgi:hypothetical protein
MSLLGAIAVVEGLGLIHTLLGGWLLDRLLEGSVPIESADDYDTQTVVYGFVWIGIYIPTAIAFLAWLSRSVANAPALGAGIPPSSPRAAIGWWFVPFANLVKPYQIVKDLYERVALMGDPRRWTRLVLAWWLLYLLGNLVGNVGSRLYAQDDELEVFRTAFVVLAFGHFVSAIAAVLAILVIRRIQTGEDQLAGRMPVAAPVRA